MIIGMTDVSLPPGVRWTALLTTYARAQEQCRPDPLFDDQGPSR